MQLPCLKTRWFLRRISFSYAILNLLSYISEHYPNLVHIGLFSFPFWTGKSSEVLEYWLWWPDENVPNEWKQFISCVEWYDQQKNCDGQISGIFFRYCGFCDPKLWADKLLDLGSNPSMTCQGLQVKMSEFYHTEYV